MRQYPRARGSVTKFGYRRMMTKSRKHKFEHVLVWEATHGPVPEGFDIHHINGDKLDNRLENLQLVTRLEHKRIHSGCYRFNGRWFKRCRRCRWYREVDTEFYVYPGRSGVMGICRRCAVDVAVQNEKKRRQRREAQRAAATTTTKRTPTETAGVESGERR